MDSRHRFKVAAIKTQIQFREAERGNLFKMMTSSQVNLAWMCEHWNDLERDLRLLHRDLSVREKLESEEEADE